MILLFICVDLGAPINSTLYSILEFRTNEKIDIRERPINIVVPNIWIKLIGDHDFSWAPKITPKMGRNYSFTHR